ncbi:MAG: CHAT domain-containing protein [Candidatus Aminicenantes bacterium]|jgi:hypothetical protein
MDKQRDRNPVNSISGSIKIQFKDEAAQTGANRLRDDLCQNLHLKINPPEKIPEGKAKLGAEIGDIIVSIILAPFIHSTVIAILGRLRDFFKTWKADFPSGQLIIKPNEKSIGRQFPFIRETDMEALYDLIKRYIENVIKRILILASNPKATPQLRLDEEIREIDEGLRRSKHRDQFNIQAKCALRLRDLRRAILDYEPHIVHFTGHGNEDGLLVEDELGMAVRISTKALAGLFDLFSDQVECVLLSACYSAPQSAAIGKHINYVIGMRREIKDKAVIEFAVGFYDALGAGKSVEEAFKFGCNAILAMFPDLSEHLIPVLRKKIPGTKV